MRLGQPEVRFLVPRGVSFGLNFGLTVGLDRLAGLAASTRVKFFYRGAVVFARPRRAESSP